VARPHSTSATVPGDLTPRVRWRLLGLQQGLSYALRRGDLVRASEVNDELRAVLDELRPLRPAA
jgi:hypothetical protein